MDITDTFRPEDLPKTDFFDFVTSDAIGIGHGTSMSTDSLDPPLQGFDQVNLVSPITLNAGSIVWTANNICRIGF